MTAPFLRRLLVATDGREDGTRAIEFGILLARRHGSELMLCHAVDEVGLLGESFGGYGNDDDIRAILQQRSDEVTSMLREGLALAKDAGVTACAQQLSGMPADAILGCEAASVYDAIVVGTRGESGLARAVLGSTVTRVMQRTRLPLFVAPACATATTRSFARILVAIDDSEPSKAAADFAMRLAVADGSRLIYCGVADTDNVLGKPASHGGDGNSRFAERRTAAMKPLVAAADRAAAMRVACETIVVEGDPASEILRATSRLQAGCIVIGTHGRRGLQHWVFGSVAECIAQRSLVPIVVARA